MGRVSRLFSNSYWRLWLVTVAPACIVFVLGALALRKVVRHEVAELIYSNEPPEAAFDMAFTGVYIAVGAVVATAIATLLTAFFVKRNVLDPYWEVIGLTKRLAQGDYSVRANPGPRAGPFMMALAGNVNALAESLQLTETMRRSLVSTMAHEIRTPLTTLEGYLEAMRDGVIEPNQEALDSVYDEVMRLVRLVDGLQQLARADAIRARPIHYEPTDLDSLVQQLVRVVRPHAEARGISLLISLGCPGRLVPAHADSFAQILRNLLRNAVTYADEGGTIMVTSGVKGDRYRLTIMNTGVEISPADLPQIFDRFYRTEHAKQSGVTGFGIGLAVVKELVTAHGGDTYADSRDGTTTISFTIPVT